MFKYHNHTFLLPSLHVKPSWNVSRVGSEAVLKSSAEKLSSMTWKYQLDYLQISDLVQVNSPL